MGETLSRTYYADFALGGVGSKISARGKSHRETCIYTLFQRSIGLQVFPGRGGPMLCAPQVRRARVGPVAMSVFMTHFDGVEGLL
jgi:hypothetical protein